LLHVLRGDGAQSIGYINITENLHSALQNLRKHDKMLVLWVDAICIDQSNIPERNSQVSNIPQVYTEAASVLVWLGTDDTQEHDGRVCLDFFTELAALIKSSSDSKDEEQEVNNEDLWRKRFEINQRVSKFLDKTKPRSIISFLLRPWFRRRWFVPASLYKTDTRPINSFLSRPWFRRRWIVQEVVLGRKVLVHCGESSIEWNKFELALTELFENDKGGFSKEHRTTLRTMSRIRHTVLGVRSQVPLDTLLEFESFICADPKDRLYALYGVIQHWFPGLPDNEVQTGSVDYALQVSIEEVYTDFAIAMMKLNDSLPPNITYNPIIHVLQLAAAFQLQQPCERRKTSGEACKNIPSWVPDWTGALTYTPLKHTPIDLDASRGIAKHKPVILNSDHGARLLVFPGLLFDTITAVVSFDISPLVCTTRTVYGEKAAINDFLHSVLECFNETSFFGTNIADRNKYQPTEQHIIVAVATTIVANWEHTPPNNFFAQHRQFPGDFLRELGKADYCLPEILHKWPAYVELVTITMRGRGFFLTKKGYIGICAANVQAGDAVCILSDMQIPFILRPNGGEADTNLQEHGSSTVHDYYQFQNENRFKEVVSMIEEHPQAHRTFKMMGDAYTHGLMDGEAATNVGVRLVDSLQILPIA
jgi:hypothetical protein